VRPQAVDAVPVGAVRRRGVAQRQARDHQARRANVLQHSRPARKPARGGAAGPARARRSARGRLPRARGAAGGRVASRAARMDGRRRLLHHARALRQRATAVGSLRRRREEGRPRARVGARAGRRAGAGGYGVSGMTTPVLDTRGRRLRNLRVSVTDRCNLRCGYCMPEEEYVWLPREEILHFEEISRLVDVFIELGVDKVRLTGGEPLLRRDLPALIRLLAAKPALRDLAITTNGVLLAAAAPALRAAGLHRVTVSLHTLRPERVVEDSTAPADRFRLSDGTVFGIISSTTAPFCAACDRSRLTADGLWYLCLYAMRGLDLRGPLRGGASNAQLTALITGGWTARTDRGAEDRLALGQRTPLIQVGGLKRDPHLEMHTRGG